MGLNADRADSDCDGVTSVINFKVYHENGGAHNVALNPGAAVCTPNKDGTLPHNVTIWTCTLNLAPGAAGNEAVSLDYGTCNVGNSLVSRVQILSPDGYTVNNDVTVNVCP